MPVPRKSIKRPFVRSPSSAPKTKDCAVLLTDVSTHPSLSSSAKLLSDIAAATDSLARRVDTLESACKSYKEAHEKFTTMLPVINVVQNLLPLATLFERTDKHGEVDLTKTASFFDFIAGEVNRRLNCQRQVVALNIQDKIPVETVRKAIFSTLKLEDATCKCRRLRKSKPSQCNPILLEFEDSHIARYIISSQHLLRTHPLFSSVKMFGGRSPLRRDVANRNSQLLSPVAPSPALAPSSAAPLHTTQSKDHAVDLDLISTARSAASATVDTDGTQIPPTFGLRPPTKKTFLPDKTKIPHIWSHKPNLTPARLSPVTSQSSPLPSCFRVDRGEQPPHTHDERMKHRFSADNNLSEPSNFRASCVECGIPTTSTAPIVPCKLGCIAATKAKVPKLYSPQIESTRFSGLLGSPPLRPGTENRSPTGAPEHYHNDYYKRPKKNCKHFKQSRVKISDNYFRRIAPPPRPPPPEAIRNTLSINTAIHTVVSHLISYIRSLNLPPFQ